jgi:hypothetical protein
MMNLSFTSVALSSFLFTGAGCAAINQTRPQDMTVPGHEEAARKDAADAEALSQNPRVGGGRGGSPRAVVAESLRERSAEHAAAAKARLEQVGETCKTTGGPVGIRSLSVTSVEPIVEPDVPKAFQSGKGYYPERLKGARITGQLSGVAEPGAVADELRCDVAQAAAGIDTDGSSNPLAVESAATTIKTSRSSVVVEVRSRNATEAAEILRRAQRFARAE